nr:hypothetical protein CFP56_59761 [Quercus suber]
MMERKKILVGQYLLHKKLYEDDSFVEMSCSLEVVTFAFILLRSIEDRQGIWDLIILWYRAIDNHIVRFPQPPRDAKQLGKSYLGNPD